MSLVAEVSKVVMQTKSNFSISAEHGVNLLITDALSKGRPQSAGAFSEIILLKQEAFVRLLRKSSEAGDGNGGWMETVGPTVHTKLLFSAQLSSRELICSQ